ncbi:MAG: zf-HC2 domain-containing protein [bacterium]|nr:zf-HC2 domain-containing protein [bacterium]
MTCQELVDFLMDYLGDELPQAQRSVFTNHLKLCPPCLAYLDSYVETVNLGRGLCTDPDGDVPADCPEELVTAILAARQAASD